MGFEDLLQLCACSCDIAYMHPGHRRILSGARAFAMRTSRRYMNIAGEACFVNACNVQAEAACEGCRPDLPASTERPARFCGPTCRQALVTVWSPPAGDSSVARYDLRPLSYA